MTLKRKRNLKNFWYLGYLHLTDGAQAAMGCITRRQHACKISRGDRVVRCQGCYGSRGVSGWQEVARVSRDVRVCRGVRVS